MQPDEDDFEIELDDDDDFEIDLEEITDIAPTSKHKVGDKVIAVGGYLPGDERAVAVVVITAIIDWSKVNPAQNGTAYVVKHQWGNQLSMSVTKAVKRKKETLFVTVDGMYYVDRKDIHQHRGERSTNSIRKRLFPKKQGRRNT